MTGSTMSSEVETDEALATFAARKVREAFALLFILPCLAIAAAVFCAIVAGAISGPPA